MTNGISNLPSIAMMRILNPIEPAYRLAQREDGPAPPKRPQEKVVPLRLVEVRSHHTSYAYPGDKGRVVDLYA